ncbi:MAG: PspC domain-containing protein [Acidobacteriota bacterium]|nr:PspC domain-containing protein [Acidobacteriota bacterium]
MYCSSCGQGVPDGARYCSSCGAVCTPAYGAAAVPVSRLTRSRSHRMVAGICAGIAVAYGWDLAVTRLVVALLVIFTGVGLLAYLIAWLVIPEAPPEMAFKTN